MGVDFTTSDNTTAYKPGGTAILLTKAVTSTIQNHTRDRMGRWTTVSLNTKTSRKIRIISAYQVCQGHRRGSTTAASQQRAHIIEESATSGLDSRQTPRQQCIHDLQVFIRQVQAADEDIILTGDFNEEMAHPTSGIDYLARNCGLADLFSIRLGSPHLPATYQRGHRRIDYVLITPTLLQHVQAAGYDPFGYRIPSDHRGLYIDFSTDALFNHDLHQLASADKRDFFTTTPDVVKKYVTAKTKYLQDHMFFDRLRTLHEGQEVNHALAESLDRDFQRAARHAARVCSRRQQPPWSPKLAACWATLHYYRLAQSATRTHVNLLPALQRLQQQWPDLPTNIPTDRDQIQQGYTEAIQRLREVRQEAQAAREEFLSKRAAMYEALDEQGKSRIVQRLLKAEMQRRTYKKLQYLRNHDVGSKGLTSIKIPREGSLADTEYLKTLPDAPEYWETVTVPKDIATIIMKRNQHHFGQAEGTPFTRPPLQADIGYKADGYAAELILHGQIEYTSIPEAMSLLIKHLQRRTTQQLDGEITKDQIRDKLRTWHEKTTTSPSGIHLGHYHCLWKPVPNESADPAGRNVTTMQENLLAATTTMLNYAIRFGYTFQRWRKVVNIMLQKDSNNPRIHRLRVIHIYKADYNMLLAVKWRQAMYRAEKQRLLNDGLYGSRPGRTAHDPVLIEVLQNEIYRMSMKPGIHFDLDAASCYDRILVNVASLCSRRLGMNKWVVHVNAQTLETAQYYLKTNLGISEGSYEHSPTFPLHGTGQGSGNSPYIWCFVCSALFDAFSANAHGAHFVDYNRSTTIRVPIIGYVDDCTQRVNMFDAKEQSSTARLITLMEKDAQLWSDLLWSSGGALEHSKCSFHMIQSEWNSDGHPFLSGKCNQQDLILRQQQKSTTINHMSNYQAHKTLGCYINPAHIQRQSFNDILTKNETFANLLETNYFTRMEAWTLYTSMYMPSITYSLPMNPLSKLQCEQLDVRFLRTLLPRCGYNRHTSRAIRYAPRHMGGAAFRQVYMEQGAALTQHAYKHLNSPHTTIGQLLRIAISWTQAFLGISRPILTDVSCPLPPSGPSWILDLRQFLHTIGGSLILRDYPVPGLLREYDRCIMDVTLQQTRWKPRHICQINSCRRYLQAQTLADITTATGTRLLPYVINGSPLPPTNTIRVSLFHQQRPGTAAWRTWKKFVATITDKHGVLINPLGRWTTSWNKLRHRPKYVYNPMYSHAQDDHYYIHARIGTGQFQLRHDQTTHIPTGYPTAVISRRDRLLPVKNYIDSTATDSPTSREFTSSHPQSINQNYRALHNIQRLRPQEVIQAHLETGHFIICSDGSVQESKGSFGYIISTLNGTKLVQGSGPAPGSNISSFRSEAYGVLAALQWVLTAMNTGCNCPPDPVIVHHYLDNKAVIRRIAKTIAWPGSTPNHRLLSDQDVIDEIIHVWRTLPVHICFSWVKGHQDSQVPFHQLAIESQMNCEADLLAKRYRWPAHVDHNEVPMLPTTQCQLFIQRKTITGQMKARIYDAATIPPLLQYLRNKYSWTEQTLQIIDWINYSHSIRKYHHNWPTIVKHLHDISPTGRVAHRNNPLLPHECPACNHPHEDNLHVLICPAPSRVVWRNKVLAAIQNYENPKSNPYLMDILQDGLRRFHQQLPTIEPHHYPQQYADLIITQNQMGWDQLYKGRWSTHWRICQEAYHTTHSHDTPTIISGPLWVLGLSRMLIDRWLDLWNIRNNERHGKDQDIQLNLREQLAQIALAELYELKREVCPADTHIFYDTLEEHLDNHSIANIEEWVTTYRDAIKASIKHAKTLGIHRNSNIREYPTINPISQSTGQTSLPAGSPTG